MKTPTDKIIANVHIAMNEWSEEQLLTLDAAVKTRLDKHRDEILMKLMGFEADSWNGRWKIDSCNGRAGDSNISDFLKEKQGEKVREWLSQIELPKMSDKFKRDITKDLLNTYERELNSLVYGVAKKRAEADMAELLKTILPETLLEKHMKTMALITDDPNTSVPTP